jgi:CRISPR-associated protein Csm1
MSLQIFLYGQFRGIESFVAGAGRRDGEVCDRSLWISLLTEIAPRAFLAEQGLSPLLAGYSGGGGFLLLLPEPAVGEAEGFFARLRDGVESASGGDVELHWTWTENLGTWEHIWKRLREGLERKLRTPLAHRGVAGLGMDARRGERAWEGLCEQLAGASFAGWSPEWPERVEAGEGRHQWPIGAAPEGLTVSIPPREPGAFAARAQGARRWGLLRVDIDHTLARLSAAQDAESFRFTAHLYKNLVAGELQRIAAMDRHKDRMGILYSGGDDFAAVGAWDALLSVAIEFHRVFTLFSRDLPGGREMSEGATLSAALTVAAPGEGLAAVWAANRVQLETVKSSGRNAFSLFDRILEWSALDEAEALKGRMRKLREVFGCPAELFGELAEYYEDYGASDGLASLRARRRERRFDRPWRFHRRLRRLAGDRWGTEFERQWRAFVGELIGRGQVQKQLRPAGRVALEWAQLEAASRR